MIFQTYPSMNHQINYSASCLQEKSHPSNILESLVINIISWGIRNLPGICLIVEGVHYFLYAHVVCTFVEVDMKYRKKLLNSMLLIYRGCICLFLQISIAASYLLCIMYFSVISHGHSMTIYGTSDKNNSHLMEIVSTLIPINSNSPTGISLLSVVDGKIWQQWTVKEIYSKGHDS